MQLDMFAAPPMAPIVAQPNAHGVYSEDGAEVMTLPRDKTGWTGAPLAQISLLNTTEGWLMAVQANTMMAGFGHGLSGRFGGGFHASRWEALKRGKCALLAFCIGSNGDAADRNRIRHWVATLA